MLTKSDPSFSGSKSIPLIRPGWAPINVFIMIIGFLFFWPAGLAMLAYCLWGHQLSVFIADTKRLLNIRTDWISPGESKANMSTGNTAFDAYREAEMERLHEERVKLDDMIKEFDDHMESLRKARDKEEFDRFMARR